MELIFELCWKQSMYLFSNAQLRKCPIIYKWFTDAEMKLLLLKLIFLSFVIFK